MDLCKASDLAAGAKSQLQGFTDDPDWVRYQWMILSEAEWETSRWSYGEEEEWKKDILSFLSLNTFFVSKIRIYLFVYFFYHQGHSSWPWMIFWD